MRKLIILLSIVVFACKSTEVVPLGNEFTLILNETTVFETSKGKVSATIKDIVDSRCPVDANCVRAGEVIVDISFNNSDLKLCLGCTSEFNIEESVSVEDFKVSLVEVLPYPYLSQPSTAKDKVVTLKID